MKYNKFLGYAALTVFILSVVFAVYAAVRIHPFFGWMGGVMDANQKYRLLVDSAVLSAASGAAVLLLLSGGQLPGCTAGNDKFGTKDRFPLRLISLIVCTTLPCAGILMMSLLPRYQAAYLYAAAALLLYPLCFSLLLPVGKPSGNRKRQLLGLLCILLLALLYLLQTIFLMLRLLAGSLMFSLLLFPVSLLTAALLFLERGRFSRLSEVALTLPPASFALYACVFPFGITSALIAAACVFVPGFLFAAFCIASDLIRKKRVSETK